MLVIFSLPVSTMPIGCQDFPAPLHSSVDARETPPLPMSGLGVPRMTVRTSLPASFSLPSSTVPWMPVRSLPPIERP